jgi:hypothetical protein
MRSEYPRHLRQHTWGVCDIQPEVIGIAQVIDGSDGRGRSHGDRPADTADPVVGGVHDITEDGRRGGTSSCALAVEHQLPDVTPADKNGVERIVHRSEWMTQRH